jgi:outer membrane beta-barrel protein
VEGRIRNIFLVHIAALSACFCGLYATVALAVEPMTADTEQVIKPQVERREIKEPKIDTEDIEVGVFGGLLSVEDFGVNPVLGARAAYHISEDIFVEAAIGQSTTTKTSYERLSGASELLTADERKLSYYNLSLGYNVLPGEAFVTAHHAFNTALYIIAGVGSTHFAGDDRFTVNLGSGYRFLATDWLAIHGDVRDHLFDMDLFGSKQKTNNIEITLGATAFF